MALRPEYRALLAVDIERSAGRGNTALHLIRDALGRALRQACARSGIEWRDALRDDLGDGFRLTAPAGTEKARLVHPLVPELAAGLREHNRTAAPKARVRVRVALHAGDVFVDPAGPVTGQPLEVLARLLDAAPARAALRRAPAFVTASLLLSSHFHEETVRHGYPGIDPETFHRVPLAEKEYTAHAWLHLPGYAGPAPVPEDDGGVEREMPPARGGARMVNRASGHGVVYALQSGTQHIHVTREQ